jgi:hypothetical protein
MKRLEFWPDYSGALLWTDSGVRVAIEDLSLTPGLIARATRWVAAYDDAKLPWESSHDDGWLSEGRGLFLELRRELAERGFDLEPHEDFWGAVPSATGETPT